jgi:hypothetical protein
MSENVLRYQEFYKRYYLWCLEEWKLELTGNLSRLRSFEEQCYGDVIIRAFNEIPPDEVWNFCKALVKRFFPDKLHLWGEIITDRDREYIQLYFSMIERKNLEPIFYSTTQEEFLEEMREKILSKTSRKIVQKKVIDSLYPILGNISEKDGTTWWQYETEIGPWKLKTCVDTGGRFHQLAYQHSIVCPEKCLLIEGVSFLRWLGIRGGGMDWDNITDENIDRIIANMTDLIKHFVNAAPKLLEGIEPELFRL